MADFHRWNSAIVSTMQSNEFKIFIADQNFQTSSIQHKRRALSRLDNAACMQAHSPTLLQRRRNLVTITKTAQPSTNNSILAELDSEDFQRGLQTQDSWSPIAWVCSGTDHDWDSYRLAASLVTLRKRPQKQQIGSSRRRTTRSNIVSVKLCLSHISYNSCTAY